MKKFMNQSTPTPHMRQIIWIAVEIDTHKHINRHTKYSKPIQINWEKNQPKSDSKKYSFLIWNACKMKISHNIPNL